MSSQKVVLITGASRGIGAATARLAAADGYAVVVNFVSDRTAAAGVADDISSRGGRAIVLQADVSSEPDVLRMFNDIDAHFGRLDALVNNAAIVARAAKVEEFDAARLARMFAVNVIGAFLCAREAVRRMSTACGGRGGSIVNVSSAASRYGSPNEYVDYAAAKAALDTFTIGLAKEVAAEGIRVNAVRPGITYTEIHAASGDPDRAHRLSPRIPMRRAAQPDEIARAILWLLSEAASYTSGALLDVSGGL